MPEQISFIVCHNKIFNKSYGKVTSTYLSSICHGVRRAVITIKRGIRGDESEIGSSSIARNGRGGEEGGDSIPTVATM